MSACSTLHISFNILKLVSIELGQCKLPSELISGYDIVSEYEGHEIERGTSKLCQAFYKVFHCQTLSVWDYYIRWLCLISFNVPCYD